MIKPISCKCPNCQADVTIEEGREFAFCSYCGTKFYLQDDSVKVNYEIHRDINDADIIREKAKEKILAKKLDSVERKNSFKRKLIVAYIIACIILGLSTYYLLSSKQNSMGAFTLIATILLVTVPLMIKITLSMIRYGETTVTTDTESSWFGLKKQSSQQVHSPVTTAAIMWLVYVLMIWCVFTMVHPDYSLFPFFSTASKSSESSASIEAGAILDEEIEIKILDEEYYSNIVNNKEINANDVGSTYAFMADGWDCYVATILSDDTIQVQRYNRSTRDEKHPLKYEKDVCLVKTNSDEYDFSWIDSTHKSFVITMKDENNSRFSSLCRTPFSSVDLNSKTWKKNYSSEGKIYQYQRDKWNIYKAILLTDNVMKIEEWKRFWADDKTPFSHERDVLIINCDKSTAGFEWIGEDETSFTIKFRDRQEDDWTEDEEACFVLSDENKKGFFDKLFGK